MSISLLTQSTNLLFGCKHPRTASQRRSRNNAQNSGSALTTSATRAYENIRPIPLGKLYNRCRDSFGPPFRSRTALRSASGFTHPISQSGKRQGMLITASHTTTSRAWMLTPRWRLRAWKIFGWKSVWSARTTLAGNTTDGFVDSADDVRRGSYSFLGFTTMGGKVYRGDGKSSGMGYLISISLSFFHSFIRSFILLGSKPSLSFTAKNLHPRPTTSKIIIIMLFQSISLFAFMASALAAPSSPPTYSNNKVATAPTYNSAPVHNSAPTYSSNDNPYTRIQTLHTEVYHWTALMSSPPFPPPTCPSY